MTVFAAQHWVHIHASLRRLHICTDHTRIARQDAAKYLLLATACAQWGVFLSCFHDLQALHFLRRDKAAHVRRELGDTDPGVDTVFGARRAAGRPRHHRRAAALHRRRGACARVLSRRREDVADQELAAWRVMKRVTLHRCRRCDGEKCYK